MPGSINLLPALPTAWPDGRVAGLCARGGFVVDMAWKDGMLTEATIRSKLGNVCRVRCGHARVLQIEGSAGQPTADGAIEFATTAGEVYRLVS